MYNRVVIFILLIVLFLVIALIIRNKKINFNNKTGGSSNKKSKHDTMLIRRAKSSDVPKIKELADIYMKMIDKYKEISVEQVEDLVMNNSHTYVYYDDKIIKGFITIIPDKKLLRLLVVDPDYRKQKIGTKLMNYIKNLYKNLSLFIDKVNPFYDVLVNFYKKYDYMIVEENNEFIKMIN